MTGVCKPILGNRADPPEVVMLPSDAPTVALGWMSRGACHGEDPELFFPVATNGAAVHQITAAKAACARCPVRAICLAYAVTTRQEGIWGGTTPDERRALREYADSPVPPQTRPARPASITVAQHGGQSAMPAPTRDSSLPARTC